MKARTYSDMGQLASQLSNNDLEALINIVAERLDVFVGCVCRHQISSRVESACVNGPFVQVNVQLADLDDIGDNRFVRSGLVAWATKWREEWSGEVES